MIKLLVCFILSMYFFLVGVTSSDIWIKCSFVIIGTLLILFLEYLIDYEYYKYHEEKLKH